MEHDLKILRQFESLKEVPDSQLTWLMENSSFDNIEEGGFITTPGVEMGGPYFVLDGRIELYMKQGNENREIRILINGGIFGYLPYSRGIISGVFARAISPVRILSFKTACIRKMISDHFELTQALVHIMNNRVKDFTTLQQQNDKMAALGKMAAGLAHELNNPAAALVRDATTLRKFLWFEPNALKELIALQLSSEQIETLNKEISLILSAKGNVELSLKERTKREDLFTVWLEKKGIANAEELAESLVELNVTFENLECIERCTPQSGIDVVFYWIKNILAKEQIIENILIASGRIGELITSVKIYTHMDRGSNKILTDIHEGIRNTLNIFAYKLRKGNIVLHENYNESLPPVLAYPGELNQVWTNLIDNAIDAMEKVENGILTIITEIDRAFVKVTINDNGTGIPDNVKQNIFDPFFTTKEIGKGTGMGLETVQRIMQQHKGSVKVTSIPGNTTFIICFPIDSNLHEN